MHLVKLKAEHQTFEFYISFELI